MPYRLDGRRASTTQPADWTDYDLARGVLESHPKDYSGLGFVFDLSDPFVGIDLDDCLEDTTGDAKPCVRAMVERFGDTYIEVSPSGLGLKIWCSGKLPGAVGQIRLEGGGALEMYDRARYFTVTGNVFRNAPLEIEDHTDDILALFNTLTGPEMNDGETARYQILPEGKIPHGTQHLTLISLAGTLRRRGVCDRAIEACLQAVNRHQCERPGPAENICRIVQSTRTWSQR